MGRGPDGDGSVFARCKTCRKTMVVEKKRRVCPACGGTDAIWVAVISLGVDAGGSRRRKTIYGKTQEAVTTEKHKLLAKSAQGMDVAPKRMTVAQFVERWLRHTKTKVELRTWVYYESNCRVHIVPGLGGIQISRLKPLHIQELYTQMQEAGRKPATIRHVHEVLCNALNRAVDWEVIHSNPAERVKLARATRTEMPSLTVEQARLLIGQLDGHPLGSLYLTALMTGMREGELAGLRWTDVDFAQGHISVAQTVWIYKGKPVFKPYPKNRKPRRLPIMPIVARWLMQHRDQQTAERQTAGDGYQDHGLVWARENGLPLRPEYMLDQWRLLLDQAGLPRVRLHDSRHTTASLLLYLGANLKDVSEIMGHSGIEITADRYGHMLPGADREYLAKLERTLFSDTERRLH